MICFLLELREDQVGNHLHFCRHNHHGVYVKQQAISNQHTDDDGRTAASSFVRAASSAPSSHKSSAFLVGDDGPAEAITRSRHVDHPVVQQAQPNFPLDQSVIPVATIGIVPAFYRTRLPSSGTAAPVAPRLAVPVAQTGSNAWFVECLILPRTRLYYHVVESRTFAANRCIHHCYRFRWTNGDRTCLSRTGQGCRRPVGARSSLSSRRPKDCTGSRVHYHQLAIPSHNGFGFRVGRRFPMVVSSSGPRLPQYGAGRRILAAALSIEDHIAIQLHLEVIQFVGTD
jgi:hypothetical protein